MRIGRKRWMTGSARTSDVAPPLVSAVFAAIALTGVLLLPGCGGDGESPAPAEPTATNQPAEPPVELENQPSADEQADAAAAVEEEMADSDDAVAEPPTTAAETEEAEPAMALDDVEPFDLRTAIARWDQLIGAAVTYDGRVDYARLNEPEHRETLDRVVASFAAADPPEGEDARLAMLINAYNANVIRMVLETWEGAADYAVSQIPGFFDERPIRVAGQTMTLDRLENNHIRPMNDPRIHAALVAAARSSPPLRYTAYTASSLTMQLDDQARRWINDPEQFYVEDNAVYASEIMKWYGPDFQRPPFSGALGFITAYADPGTPVARHILMQDDGIDLRWAPFDWSLNIGDVDE